MLKFLKWFFGIFSPFVNGFERKVNRFFKSINSTDNIATIREKLLELMRENLIVVNVWLEKKFKGYSYLSKSVRKKMYEDALKIVHKLSEHIEKNSVKVAEVKKRLEKVDLSYSKAEEEKVKYLYSIMQFLKPGEHYKYIKTASFGKLLRNPSVAKLEGDCNQIVTLYIYLYSLKFPLEDLKIKLLPEHVCLHFNGIDIEATNATFQKYKEKDVLPVTEIISTNLLDLTDFREEVQMISPRVMVKSAQLAYAISSLKPLVAKNLNTAYRNLGIGALKAKDFETAIFYISKTDDHALLKDANRHAAIYYLHQKNFSKARFYAGKCGDSDLVKSVKHSEAAYEYNKLVAVVKGDRTLADLRRHKSKYKRMLELARKLKDNKLEKRMREVLRKI